MKVICKECRKKLEESEALWLADGSFICVECYKYSNDFRADHGLPILKLGIKHGHK